MIKSLEKIIKSHKIMRIPKTSIILISAIALSLSFSVALAKDFSLPDAGLTPDNPLYFLKAWKEKIQLFFTFGEENKTKQYLHLASVRLAEYQKMIKKGKADIADKTIKKYEDQLNRALDKAKKLKEKGKEIKNLSRNLEETTSKHLEVLQQNLEKAPEQAQKGLKNAIENSQKQIKKILEKKNSD